MFKEKHYTAIHPTAIVGEGVRIGKGTVVMAGTVTNPHAEVAEHCILNSRSVAEHDCSIGDYSHISLNTTLVGGVKVDNECWVGAGSSIIQGLTTREKTIVGAGSVVIKDLPANCTAVGAPTKAIKFYETN